MGNVAITIKFALREIGIIIYLNNSDIHITPIINKYDILYRPLVTYEFTNSMLKGPPQPSLPLFMGGLFDG